jgi:hypothetical protein
LFTHSITSVKDHLFKSGPKNPTQVELINMMMIVIHNLLRLALPFFQGLQKESVDSAEEISIKVIQSCKLACPFQSR